jgi:hypothetical protein
MRTKEKELWRRVAFSNKDNKIRIEERILEGLEIETEMNECERKGSI